MRPLGCGARRDLAGGARVRAAGPRAGRERCARNASKGTCGPEPLSAPQRGREPLPLACADCKETAAGADLTPAVSLKFPDRPSSRAAPVG